MAIKSQDLPLRAAFDVQGAQDIRSQFQKDPQGGLKAAAQQFETMFLQMVLKSMRDTVPSDGLLQSDQTRFYNGLLDQQMAQNMATSGKGIGFAALIEQQLGRQMAAVAPEASIADDAASLAGSAGLSPPARVAGQLLRYQQVASSLPTSAAYGAAAATTPAASEAPADAKAFVNQVWPHAVEASRSTGIAPQFLVAHAALESGWGRSDMQLPNGQPAYNLFGIKAGKNWSGATVDAVTTEYRNGQPEKLTERFRAYGSYAESFRDYAQLLRNNPRYSGVIGSQDGMEFARGLQQAGYATDPMYADKLARIIHGPTLRQALIG